MRAVRRVSLAPEMVVRLAAAVTEIQSERTLAGRKRAARRVWGRKPRPLALGEALSSALIESNFGQDRCMFCESNETAGIDHFETKALAPARVADWDNLILACARCNGAGGKGAASPFRPGTRELAMLDPTGTHDPADHLAYSARGDMTSPTDLGRATIRRLKLSDGAKRPLLIRAREREWHHHNRDLLDYVTARLADNTFEELQARRRLCGGPFVGLLIYMLRQLDDVNAGVVFQAATLTALRANREAVSELLADLRPPPDE